MTIKVIFADFNGNIGTYKKINNIKLKNLDYKKLVPIQSNDFETARAKIDQIIHTFKRNIPLSSNINIIGNRNVPVSVLCFIKTIRKSFIYLVLKI